MYSKNDHKNSFKNKYKMAFFLYGALRRYDTDAKEWMTPGISIGMMCKKRVHVCHTALRARREAGGHI
jgi:hypothetical protein